MRENTFDVPAYKFFTVKINDGRSFHTFTDYKTVLNKNNIKKNDILLIPFESIDGLKVEEVRELLGTKELFLLGTTYYKAANFIERSEKISQPATVCNFKGVYFEDTFLNENCKKTIDKLYEEHMEEAYLTSNENTKRMYRCFFERYQDGSYEKTKERIKRLEMRK